MYNNVKIISTFDNMNNWKEYEKETREMVDRKIEQMEKDVKDTDGNLSNKLTTKMNIGATKESTIVGAGQELSKEMNEALGKNAVSYTNTTNPFSSSNTSSMSFNGDELKNIGFLEGIIKFFVELFVGGQNKSTSTKNQKGEIKLDKKSNIKLFALTKIFIAQQWKLIMSIKLSLVMIQMVSLIKIVFTIFYQMKMSHI